MKALLAPMLFLFLTYSAQAQEDYLKLSQDFLTAIKNKQSSDSYVAKLKAIDKEAFVKEIDTDEEKLAFWINIYNALIQHQLKKDPSLYDDRGNFFKRKSINFAGTMVSFDNLEHGVLRKGVSKYSKGYFENPFGSNWEKDYEVDEIDWRIHFALNCGAADCPPVRIYKAEQVYVQLNQSAMQYMSAQVRYNKDEDEVYVPALMSWFSGDFGGSSGVLDILHEFKQVPKEAEPDIEYKDYDWTLKLDTFYKE